MMPWWQSLPEHLNPIAFVVGWFPVRFYGLFWLLGFFGAWFVLHRTLRSEARPAAFQSMITDGLFSLFFGAVVGGRLGYAALYEPQYFLSHPMSLVFPFEGGSYTGFFGMSFFGGVIGVIVTIVILSRIHRLPFSIWSDYVALATPIAIFFGRLGNFMNGELYGRVTNAPWGMFFPLGGAVLRHPSQLYEAALEGIALFFAVRYAYRSGDRSGFASMVFIVLYGIIRFFMEFFREPDFGQRFFFGYFTLGQMYSLVFVAAGGVLWFSIWRGKSVILER